MTCEEMADIAELKNMVLSFRVSELQMLLGFAGRNKTGRKTELQARALELIRIRSPTIPNKIRELYRSIQQANNIGQSPSSTSDLPTPSPPQATSMQRPTYPQGYSSAPQQQTELQQRLNWPIDDSQHMLQSRTSSSTASVYGHGMYHQYQPRLPVTLTTTSRHMSNNPSPYPVHPDVKMKKLPFYDLLAELIKPSSLVPASNAARIHDASFTFHLTPQQATDISMSSNSRPGTKGDYAVQVQLRFCMLETSCEQEDHFPPSVSVKVNGKVLTLPNPIPSNKQGVEPKRPPRPNNITPLIKLSPTVANHVSVSWASDFGRCYTLSIYLVRKLSATDLLQRLKSKGVRHADYTRGLIKEKLNEDADCEIATTSLRVSLMCPLGKMRMITPCRPASCIHLQCFDASLYLQMNERKPTWTCPVCDKTASYDSLIFDGYFQDVLNSSRLPADCNEVQLLADGSWTILAAKKESNTQNLSPIPVPTKSEPVVETLSDEADMVSEAVITVATKKKQPVVVDLTLSDSDDDTPSTVATRCHVESVQADSSRLLSPVKTNYSDPASVSSSSSSSSSSRSSCSSASSGSGVRPASVNSSIGHSPNVITLDSPSPPPIAPSFLSTLVPSSTSTVPPPAHSGSTFIHNPIGSMHSFLPSLPSLPILDLDSDSSSSSHALRGGSTYSF